MSQIVVHVKKKLHYFEKKSVSYSKFMKTTLKWG